MNFDELQKQWQSQSGGFKLSIDADVLLKEVQRNKESFESTVFWRDVREVGVALVLAPLFLCQAAKSASWSLSLPGFACIFVGVFMIADRIFQKRKYPKSNNSLVNCIEISSAQVQHQIWLLKNVLWWALLPLGISIAVFWGDVAWQVRNDNGTGLRFIGECFVGLIVLYAGIYYLNQWAVRKYLIPRRQELEQLLRSLQNDNS
jgi:hypothetical protein